MIQNKANDENQHRNGNQQRKNKEQLQNMKRKCYDYNESKFVSRNRNALIPRLIVDYDITNSGSFWEESEFRDAWFAHYYQNKSYLSVAKLLQRTESAILTKCNLLKRAIKENPELNIPSIYKPYQFKGCYLDIINKQSLKEQTTRSQQRRIQNRSPLRSMTNNQTIGNNNNNRNLS